jgi:phage FluMu gp28-like protein
LHGSNRHGREARRGRATPPRALRVEGVLFTGPNKLALATVGKEAFEDRTIRIPLADAPLRSDLHKLQRVVSATGAPRFIAEADSAGHADRAWACFLALEAAANPAPAAEFIPVPTKAHRFDGIEPEDDLLADLPDMEAGAW